MCYELNHQMRPFARLSSAVCATARAHALVSLRPACGRARAPCMLPSAQTLEGGRAASRRGGPEGVKKSSVGGWRGD
eukprot:3850139-Pleurochrysis_carterae.AAC.1